MTAAPGIPSGSVAHSADAASKMRMRTKDDGAASGRSAFADMFTYFQKEASQTAVPTPPVIGANGLGAEGKTMSPLEAEAMHNTWFGGETKPANAVSGDQRMSTFTLNEVAQVQQQDASKPENTSGPLSAFDFSGFSASGETQVSDEAASGNEATLDSQIPAPVADESAALPDSEVAIAASDNAQAVSLDDEDNLDAAYAVQLPPESAVAPLWESNGERSGKVIAEGSLTVQTARQLATAAAYPEQGRGGRSHTAGQAMLAASDSSVAEAGSQVAQPPKLVNDGQPPLPDAAATSAQRDIPAAAARTNPQSNDSASVKMQASLSALESVLSREVQGQSSGEQRTTQESTSVPKALRDAGITSVRNETYFAPGGWSQSPSLQIAQRITHDLKLGNPLGSEQSGNVSQDSKAPVRVLHIQLDPPELGPLTVRMSLRNDALQLQLETSNQQAANLIQNDKEALTRLLRSAGYSLDGLNIQVTQTERGVGGQALGQGDNAGPGQGQQGWRQSDGRPSGQNWQGQSQDQSQGGAQHGRGQRDPQGRGRNSDYYL